MQLDENILTCVGFLGCNRKSGPVLGGTVFFLGYPMTDELMAMYAVTARHVIEDIGKRSDDGSVLLRLNGRDGALLSHPVPREAWIFHDDPSIDVAVAPLDGDLLSTIDHKLMHLSSLATSETLAQGQIGIGEELFFPGLFKHRHGDTKNLPIIRVGNIAAMPSEDIETSWGRVRAPYLIEARSIGGLSGSPVIVEVGAIRVKRGNKPLTLAPGAYLLGLIHGHYGCEEKVWDAVDVAETDDARRNSVNMGVAIVVPADQIKEVLELPALRALRDLMVAAENAG